MLPTYTQPINTTKLLFAILIGNGLQGVKRRNIYGLQIYQL